MGYFTERSDRRMFLRQVRNAAWDVTKKIAPIVGAVAAVGSGVYFRDDIVGAGKVVVKKAKDQVTDENEALLVRITELLDNPEQYVGKTVATEGFIEFTLNHPPTRTLSTIIDEDKPQFIADYYLMQKPAIEPFEAVNESGGYGSVLRVSVIHFSEAHDVTMAGEIPTDFKPYVGLVEATFYVTEQLDKGIIFDLQKIKEAKIVEVPLEELIAHPAKYNGHVVRTSGYAKNRFRAHPDCEYGYDIRGSYKFKPQNEFLPDDPDDTYGHLFDLAPFSWCDTDEKIPYEIPDLSGHLTVDVLVKDHGYTGIYGLTIQSVVKQEPVFNP